MASNQKQTRQLQLERYEQQLAARMTALQETGIEEKSRAKDKVLKQLKAQIQRTKKALAAIIAREKIISDAKEKKLKTIEQKKSRIRKSKQSKDSEETKKKEKKEKKSKQEKKET